MDTHTVLSPSSKFNEVNNPL